jgi:hypothetical protein
MEILDVAICVSSSIGKKRWFEGTVTVVEADKMRRFSFDFPIDEMKELGVCKNLGSWNKIREWANSDDGHEYIRKHKNRPDQTKLALDEINKREDIKR